MVQRSDNVILLRREDKGILAEMTVEAAVERVWRVLTSFEEMPAYLSGLSQSRILKREGVHRIVEQTARVGIPFLPLSFRVVLDVVEERPFLYFSQRNGTFNFFRGHWRVDRCSTGAGSRVCYYLEASVGQGLRRLPFEQQLPRMIRQNMEELAVWIDNAGT